MSHQSGEGDGVCVAVDLVEELQGRQGPHEVATTVHRINRVRDQTAVNGVVVHPKDLPINHFTVFIYHTSWYFCEQCERF